MANTHYFAGLDIGGTTVKAALLDSKGEQAGDMVEVRSHGSEGYQATFGQLRVALDQLCENAGVEFESIAAAGIDVPAPGYHGVLWGQANHKQDRVGTQNPD
ncbi:MAG: hypothetical protein AAF408_02350, partial [Pseudomonadota bacterium]